MPALPEISIEDARGIDMKLEFDNRNGETFLLYHCPHERLDTITLGMLKNNTIEGLLPVSVVQHNNENIFRVNITGKLSFCQMSQGKVKRERFLQLLLSFFGILKQMSDYMIEEEELVLEPDYLYMDVRNEALWLVCLPELNREGGMDSRTFLKKFLFETQYDQEENCDYVAKLINLFNSPGVTLEQMQEEVGVLLKRTKPQLVSEAVPWIQPEKEKTSELPLLPPQADLPEPQSEKEVSRNQEATKSLFSGLWGRKKGRQVAGGKEEMSSKKAKKEKKERRKVEKEGKKDLPQFLVPGMKPSLQNEGSGPDGTDGRKESAVRVDPARRQAEITEDSMQEEAATVIVREDEHDEQTVINRPVVDRKGVSIERMRTGERTLVQGVVFIMGRQESKVNYCIKGNLSIGKVHAMILQRDGKYYLVDLNSINFTYLRGEKLTPNFEYEIHTGDRFRMSDEDFKFLEYV